MTSSRPVLAVLLAVSLLSQQTAHAYPGDVFASASPVQAPHAAAAGALSSDAGHSVTDDGAARFSIPLPAAPGRGGMAPNLTLSYSSRGATRGGVAVGWSLDVPVIERDTSRGRLAFRDFRSSLSRGRLARVGPRADIIPGFQGTEEYRAREDAGGTRYVRVIDQKGTIGWRAHTTDGLVYHFGETATSKDTPHQATTGIPVQEGRFYVDRIVDRFGNEIEFTYEKVSAKLKNKGVQNYPLDIALVRIDYGRNRNAGLPHNARLLFDYPPALDLCPDSKVPIGAQFDYRTGFPLYRGARRLKAVRLEVLQGTDWKARRKLDLAYDMGELACQLDLKLHAPLRLLTSITESATAPDGTVTTLPPTVFDYGRRQRDFTRRVDFPGLELGAGISALSDKKGGGWPTVDAMLLDLDGDGLLDNLASRRNESGADGKYCEAKWQPGTGVGFTSPWTSFGLTVPDRPETQPVLPVMPWLNATRATDWASGRGLEDCSLSAQFSREENIDGGNECGYAANYLSYRFMDVNNDGLPDLVTGIDAQRGKYQPERDARLWPGTASCLDPMHCQCTDQGSCVSPTGAPELCTIIDEGIEGLFIAPADQCPNLCCAPGESGSNVPSTHSEPIQAVEGGGGGGGFTSFFLWIGSIQGPFEVAPRDEGSGEAYSSHNRDPNCQMFPESRCGHYVLRVYDNLGGGRFASRAREVLAPIPLETDRPTSQLGAGELAVSSSWHGFVDLDGDGRLDAVYKRPDWDATGNDADDNAFRVFRGYGLGSFDDNAQVWPATSTTSGGTRVRVGGDRTDFWSFPPATSWAERVPMDRPAIRAQYTSTTLRDINGDGLPDYVEARKGTTLPQRLRVLYNTGVGFEPTSSWYSSTTLHELGDASLQWLDEEQIWQDRVTASNAPSRAFSRATWRSVDLDADGLVDIVKLPPLPPEDTDDVRPYGSGAATWQPEVYFNVGDGYVRARNAPISSVWRALARIRVTHPDSGYMQGSWTVLTDFVDLDGDGLPEAVNNDSDGNVDCGVPWDHRCHTYVNAALTDPDDGQAPRALRTVRSSSGAVVRFDYDSIRTPAGRVPHAVWAVTTMTVSPGPGADGLAQPDMVTRYSYDHAEYNQDLEEQWAFRGFGVVGTTAPSGARTVTTRDFSQDYAGLVVNTRVYDRADVPTHAASITTHQYEERRVFQQGGPWPGPDEVITWHGVESLRRTCGAQQDEAACAELGALLRTSTTWSTLIPDGGSEPMVHVPTETETSPGFGVVEGAVIRTREPRLVSERHGYWIVTVGEGAKSRGPGGALFVENETLVEFDPTWRVPIHSGMRIDNSRYAITTIETDMATGNLQRVKSPRFHGADVGTRFEYDATQRFVTRTTNALGHAVDRLTDPATGVVIELRGPNQVTRSCVGCEATPREGWRKKIDGLGRTTAKDVWIDDAQYGYKLVPSERYTYADTPSPWVSVTSQRRIEINSSIWTKHVVQTDGLGRKVRASTYDNGTVQGLSRSYFDAAGDMVLARVPKPGTVAPGAYVDWKYTYDRLGRLTAAREPSRQGCTDEIGSTAWCGKRWSYDGLTSEEEDVVGTAGGQIGRTRSTHDVFGRLAQVSELQTSGAWATTSYQHDGRGHVLTTINADGVATASTYDLAGRRRTTTRGGKTWTYGYDLDGNLTSVASPVPPGGAIENYVSTIGYDVLGRIKSEVAAPRGGPDPLLGTANVVRTYDRGINGLGRVTSVVQDTQTVNLSYDALGNVSGEAHAFKILGGQFSDERTIARRFGLRGDLIELTAADHPEPASATRFWYQYNGRGLPVSALWYSGSTYKGPLEQLKYTAAGYPMARLLTIGSTTPATMTTSWDDAGRAQVISVTSILPGSTSVTQRASHTYTFDGASDVSSHLTSLSPDATTAPVHQASYSYDRMHRLVTATGPHGYTGAFAYSPGGRITAANVNADDTATRVHRRNVAYVYGAANLTQGADPDAPIRLDSVGGGTWMTIGYDPFGNAAQRQQGTADYMHTYDGADRQRSVTTADGSRELYWYGEDGRRSIVATMTAAGVVQRVKWTLGETEIWYDGNGNVEKEVAHAAVGAAVSRVEDRTRLEMLYHDSRGHLMAVIGGDGAFLAGFRYGPYGELLDQVGPENKKFLKRFNGKEFDVTSGLSYYGQRYFDERTLTWTQADSKYRSAVEVAGAEPRRASLYAFSLGNPVSQVDPDGADSGDVGWSVTSGGNQVSGFGTSVPIPERGSGKILIIQRFGGNFGRATTYENYEFNDGQIGEKSTLEALGSGTAITTTKAEGSSLKGTLTVTWATSVIENMKTKSTTYAEAYKAGVEGRDPVVDVTMSRERSEGKTEVRTHVGVGGGQGRTVTVTPDQDSWETTLEVMDFLANWIEPTAPNPADQSCPDTQTCEPAEEEVSKPEPDTSDKWDPAFGPN